MTCGFELATFLSNNDLNPDGAVSASTTVETSIVRSGARSAKCSSGVGNVVATTSPQGVGSAVSVAGTYTYFHRYCLYFVDLPSALTGFATIMGSINGATDTVSRPVRLGLDSTGLLYLVGGTATPGNVLDTSATTSVTIGEWYTFEASTTYTITAATSVALNVSEVRVNGVTTDLSYTDTYASGSPNFTPGNTSGWMNAPGASKTLYVDDVAINDATGAAQNTWAGNGKIVLLRPIALNTNGGSWTDDNNATTSAALTNAIDNTPPNGIADTTSGGGNHQVRNAAANSSLDMDLTTYASAGIAATDKINVLQPVVSVGAPSVTGAKSGSFGIASNPAITNRVFTGGTSTATFFWRGSAPITYGPSPTGWGWEMGTTTYGSSVTVASSPVARLTITGGTTTRIAMCQLAALYVDFTPAGALPPAPSFRQASTLYKM